jgi:osmotically-inducible protein OsmY
MGDRWSDDRDRRWRERDWRRAERYGRGRDDEREDERRLAREDRTWSDEGERFGAHRDPVFGEQETGASYRRPGALYGGESYGRGAGGRPTGYRSGSYRSSSLQGGGYRGPAPRVSAQDYTEGGRFYGDDESQPIYRQEYGQGGVEYGDVPRGYDAERDRLGGQDYGGRYEPHERYGTSGDDGESYGRPPDYGSGALRREYQQDLRRPVSGGTGGYDYERGYGNAGRREFTGSGERWIEHERRELRDERRDERRDEGPGGHGDFLQRASERLASWFGGETRRDDRGERPRIFSGGIDREARRQEERGHRGLGPKGYRRSDDRISDEINERLTDDTWLDASNIAVSVSAGEVTLSGTVDSREAKHRAERIVEDISGLSHVQNNLRVARGGFLTSPASGYGDSVLEAQMREGDTSATGGRTRT